MPFVSRNCDIKQSIIALFSFHAIAYLTQKKSHVLVGSVNKRWLINFLLQHIIHILPATSLNRNLARMIVILRNISTKH